MHSPVRGTLLQGSELAGFGFPVIQARFTVASTPGSASRYSHLSLLHTCVVPGITKLALPTRISGFLSLVLRQPLYELFGFGTCSHFTMHGSTSTSEVFLMSPFTACLRVLHVLCSAFSPKPCGSLSDTEAGCGLAWPAWHLICHCAFLIGSGICFLGCSHPTFWLNEFFYDIKPWMLLLVCQGTLS